MKERVSATIDPKTKEEIKKLLRSGRYRNISHVIEDAIKLLGEVTNAKNKR